MRRRTFDALATTGRLRALPPSCSIAGGLLVWGHSFVASEVHTQLAAQKIVFPTANRPGDQGAADRRRRCYEAVRRTAG